MKHEHYPHKITAVYQDAVTATKAVRKLEGSDLGDVKVLQLSPDADNVDQAIEPEREAVRDSLVNDTLAGGAAGTAAGAVVSGAAAIIAPSLFIAAPVAGPLIVLGYGAMLGGIAGAIRGVRPREGELAALVKDALNGGYHVVMVHAVDEEARQKAEAVINETITEETAHT